MSVPVVTITCESDTLPLTAEVLSLVVHHELNRVPEANLTLLDGSIAQQVFELSNSVLFEPGKAVTIALRHGVDEADQTVFAGLVVRHAVETRSRGSVLRVELKDAAFKLTRRRKSAVFRQQTDDAAIRTLIEGAGLQVGELATTKPEHEELLQYYASDWDFIVSRADVQGLVVQVALGVVSLLPMIPAKDAEVTLEYGGAGSSVQELELELDGGAPWAEVDSVTWDLAEQSASAPTVAKDPEVNVGKLDTVKIGNLDAAAIAAALGGEAYSLVHPAVLDPEERQAWADARLARSRLALLGGRAVVDGRVDVAPGDLVTLQGIGERFNGPAFVRAVVHTVDHDGWRTELQLGLGSEWFAREPDIADPPAAGLLPPVSGLHIATVAAFEADPQGEHRIKLQLPELDTEQGVVWARFAHPEAGKERGQVLWPELGDEVVVGFIADDPRQAVVLGSLYSKTNPPPALGGPPSEDNFKRAFVTKEGSHIVFDGEKKAITISTPGKNAISIDDDAQSITIADSHGNTVVMSDKGITITSVADLMLKADGEVVISGSAVDVQ